ncbi:hypothetical protein OESDEN_19655, partial [Oesophagostomum dentatum]
RSFRRDGDRSRQPKESARDRSKSRRPDHRSPERNYPTYRPDGRQASGDDDGKNGGDPRNELVAKLRRFFAISLFAYGVLYMLTHSPYSPKSDGPAAFEPITWSDFVNHVLPTGQIQKIIVFPEKDVAFIYTYAGSKLPSGGKVRLLNVSIRCT